MKMQTHVSLTRKTKAFMYIAKQLKVKWVFFQLRVIHIFSSTYVCVLTENPLYCKQLNNLDCG